MRSKGNELCDLEHNVNLSHRMWEKECGKCAIE